MWDDRIETNRGRGWPVCLLMAEAEGSSWGLGVSELQGDSTCNPEGWEGQAKGGDS